MTTGDNHPKNQHYVPQFLLRNFLDDTNSRIHAFDKLSGSSFSVSPRNVAAEGGFYDYDGKQDSLEPLLSRLEAKVSAIINGIIKHESLAQLTRDDRIWLSLFAAVQQLRVKGIRHKLKSMNAGIRRVLQERGIDPGDVVPEMNDDDIKRQCLSHIQMAKEFSQHYFDKLWILQRAPDNSPFYTSDNPIALHNLIKSPGRGNLGIISPGVEIYLPISKQFSICFFCKSMFHAMRQELCNAEVIRKRFGCCPDLAPFEKIIKLMESGDPDLLLPDNVIHQNSLQVLQSSRFVFSSNDNFDLVRLMLARDAKLKNPPEMTVH
ncbi:MAG: DUF4238 domain-containing protein [Planctomycetes bacterium]|nr:DUF4238 domain-containing protein [Planctomycetota bacterium]